MPKFSIITTTYNHEKFISYTIESLLNQTYTDWELLIGDDYSIDATFHVVEKYAKIDSRIKIWKHEKNLGIVGNMNFLLSQVHPNTKYISFLEGDDMYDPFNLEKKYRVFQKYRDVQYIFTDYSIIDSQGNIGDSSSFLYWLKNRSRLIPAGKICMSLQEFLNRGNPIQSFGSVCITYELANKLFPIQLPISFGVGMFGPLDYYCWTNIIPNTTIYHIKEKLFLYRQHAGNFVKKQDIMIDQFILLYDNLKECHKDNKEIQYICNRFIAGLNLTKYFIKNDMKNTFFYWRETFRYDIFRSFFLRIGMLILVCLPLTWRRAIINIYSKI